ncbi:MAG: hypothetical protein HY654_12300, partial [Acidobacteria bacterium]|nr:hypothetical protein [Acidobacteriota bacterium]
MNLVLLFVTSATLYAQTPPRRAIAYADLAPQVRDWLQGAHPDTGKDASTFEAYVRRLEARSRERRAEGEGEHLVYYVLQSTSFTDEAPIEPA